MDRRTVLASLVVALAAATPARAATCPGTYRAGCPYDRVQVLGTGDGSVLEQPRGVARAADGTILVADPGRHAVVGYGPDGGLRRTYALGGSWAGTWNPDAVAAGPDGRVWALSAGMGMLSVFAADGSVVKADIHLAGGAEHWTLSSAHAYALTVTPGGDAWVAYDSGRVERIAADGTVGQSFIAPARGDAAWPAAREVAATPSGTLIVAGPGGYDEIAPDGTVARSVAASVWWPHVAVAADGEVLLAEGQRVLRFRADGTPDGSSDGGAGLGGAGAGGIAADGGDVVLSDPDHRDIVRVRPSGDATRFGAPGADVLDGPEDVWDDGAGGVLVADTGHGRIVRFDADGRYAGVFAAVVGVHAGARDVETGMVWAATSDALIRFGSDGVEQLRVPRRGDGRADVSVGPGGTVYVPTTDAVVALSRDGTPVRSFPGFDAITPGPGSTLVALTDRAHGDISLLEADGTPILALPSGKTTVDDVAVDGDGRVYAGVYGEAVALLDRTGLGLGVLGAVRDTVPGTFAGIRGLAAGAGWLSVADPSLDRVQRLHIVPGNLIPYPRDTRSPNPPYLTVTRTSLVATHGVVRVMLRCTGNPGEPWRGRLWLATRATRRPVSLTRRVAVTIASGARRTIRLRLTTAGLRRVRQGRALGVALRAEADGWGITGTRRVSVRRARGRR